MKREELLFNYCLRLGDNNLILGHRLSEWCGHGPILEQDIALINISLDLLGQATSLLKYAGEVEGKGRSEDDLAYLRIEKEYTNVLLVEQPNGHYGDTIARQFLFDVFHHLLLQQLVGSKDKELASIAEKSLKEVSYHVKFSSEWIIRLGDGTEESHEKIQKSMDRLIPYTPELFKVDEIDELAFKEGIGADLDLIKTEWNKKVNEILNLATLKRNDSTWGHSGGKAGKHSEHMGYLLADMQYLQRTYPNAKW